MTFSKNFDMYACEGDGIRCTVDGIEFTARLVADTDSNPHEFDQPGWVYDTTSLKYGASNRAILEAWDNDDWRYVSVVIDAEAGGWRRTYLASLSGLECNFPLAIATDNPNEHLRDAANQLLPEAIAQARANLPKAALERAEARPDWDVKEGAYLAEEQAWDAANAGGDLMTSDTARVEAALRWLQQYGNGLDDIETPPNGDDWNDTRNGIVSILRDGIVPAIHLKAEGR